MKIDDFKLELFFCEHEFTAPYLLCCSDCESMSLDELLAYEPGAKEKFFNCWLGYSESPGDPELLTEISKTYKHVDEAGVLEFVGAQEAIFNFMNNALEKGDHMITMYPAYQSTYEICKAIGCEVSHWDLIQEENGWRADIDVLASLIKPNTKVIAVNSPNNPTGYTFSRGQIEAIASLAGQRGIMVFSDEVYTGLERSSAEQLTFADFYENAFSLNVLSKAYGMAGLRIGWVASQNKQFLSQMLKFKYYTSICGAVPSQKLAIIALKHREKIFEKNRKIISENLAHSDRFFKKHGDLFTCNRPMAGPIAFHKLNTKQPIAEFCEDLIKRKGVLLAYDRLFDTEGNYFRMGYGRKNFKSALDLLDEYMADSGCTHERR